MTGNSVPTCKGCGAPLRWERTKAGNRIPLDAQPNQEGNVIFELDSNGQGIAVVLGPLEAAQERERGQMWMPHHATCPKVAEFRK